MLQCRVFGGPEGACWLGACCSARLSGGPRVHAGWVHAAAPGVRGARGCMLVGRTRQEECGSQCRRQQCFALAAYSFNISAQPPPNRHQHRAAPKRGEGKGQEECLGGGAICVEAAADCWTIHLTVFHRLDG
eukprot:1140728-Pelagomonas_calceolata.AAC.5